MEKEKIIGIDVSKSTLDVCILEGEKSNQLQIMNSVTAIRKFLRKFDGQSVIVAMENTGRYNWPLYEVLKTFSYDVYVLSPLHLKRSLGLTRGKNDQIDAYRIATYTLKNRLDLRKWKAPSMVIEKLKVFLSERTQRVKMRKQLLTNGHDYSLLKSLDLKRTGQLNLALIKKLNEQIKNIEKEMQLLIKTDSTLQKQYELIQTVPGVGKILACSILVKTQAFTILLDPRKLACYCGVVPFQFQSGSSIKRKDRISIFGDKPLKTLLHLASMRSIQLKCDLREYYLRKIEEGKSKMSVLNAIRNKIIHRILAVVRNEKPYFNLQVS
jgi:transposase